MRGTESVFARVAGTEPARAIRAKANASRMSTTPEPSISFETRATLATRMGSIGVCVRQKSTPTRRLAARLPAMAQRSPAARARLGRCPK